MHRDRQVRLLLAAWARVLLGMLANVASPGPTSTAHAFEAAATAGSAGTLAEVPRLVQELSRMGPDRSRVAKVAGLRVQRDVAVFELLEGDLALAAPLGGRVCAAYFAGKARFRFSPAQEVERAQLRMRLGAASLDLPVVSICFLFADSTAEELTSAVRFGPGRFEYSRPTALENLRGLVDKGSVYIDPSLGCALLEGRRSGFFAAVVVDERGQRLRMSIDPAYTEAVSLVRVGDGGVLPDFTYSRFCAGGAGSESLERDLRPPVAVRAYRIEMAMTDGLTPHYRVEMGCEVLTDSVRFLPLYLGSLEAPPDSVRTLDGQECSVYWNRGASIWARNSLLWVDLRRMRSRGDRFRLAMRYRGMPMGDLVGLPLQHSRANWYPAVDWESPAFFDITYRFRSPLSVVSVGDSVHAETDGKGMVTSQWRTQDPIRLASWHLGELEIAVARPDSLPEIRVVNYTGSHERIVWDIQHSAGLNTGGARAKPVGNDLAFSLRFFQDRFGPLPLTQLHALESFDVHGEAYAGMIMLDWKTYRETSHWGDDEVLRAHEVAHQWWGVSVEPKTYRDRWLSEGVSEFSALWYLQAKRRDTALYLRKLADMQERIVGAPDVVSTWLGTRGAEMSGGQAAYVTSVYLKGAWVMHMLRLMLMDLENLDDARFTHLMRDFSTRYQGKRASTQDFARLTEAHVGEPMGWFFDQWIRGTAIPEYRYDWRWKPDGRGGFDVTLYVEQRRVGDGFRMPVPIRIDLEDGQVARTRVWIDKPVNEVTFNSLPAKPRHVEFNELSGVLCVAKRSGE